MFPTFNVQRSSVSGLLSVNLGGTNSAFHVPGSSPEPASPALSAGAISPTSPYLANVAGQHATLLTTLQAAGMPQGTLTVSSAISSSANGGGQSKTIGTVLPLVSPTRLHLSPAERPVKSSSISPNGVPAGACSICSDRATGKHYGANSCDGCKGFFRRTIRKTQSYSCRFSRSCVIDKDKRNTCRYCRFKKCLQAGMRREAVQNERDRISCRRVKSETPPESTSGSTVTPKFSTTDTISFLLHAENVATQIRASVITSTALGSNNNALTQQSPSSSNEQPRLATIADLSEAIKQQLLLLVEWAKLLPPFYALQLDDQVALLRSYAAQHLLLGVARRSLPYSDVLLLGNDACIPRSHSSELHDVNHVASRLLDELVDPMREIQLDDTEYACVKALLFFNPNSYGLTMKNKVKDTRQHVLEALQAYTLQKQTDSEVVRFGNILLLLPPLQAMSQQFIEDLQLATLFGMARFDKLLEELLLAAAEPLSAPFLVDGISAVANKMAGGLMGLVSGNGHSSDHHSHYNHSHRRDERENDVLGPVKRDEPIVDVITCADSSPATRSTNF